MNKIKCPQCGNRCKLYEKRDIIETYYCKHCMYYFDTSPSLSFKIPLLELYKGDSKNENFIRND
jgi:late competence protein required for DNA uptake (superfamily II DNA/RNA helicase)